MWWYIDQQRLDSGRNSDGGFYLRVEAELNHRSRAGFDVVRLEGEFPRLVGDHDHVYRYQTD